MPSAPSLRLAEPEKVALAKLTPHPENYRQHDEEALEASLREHGQTRSIVAQRSTGRVIAGNGVYAAMLAIGAKEAVVSWVEVDDDGARRILLADNRAHDLGWNDEQQLLALMDRIASDGEWTGSGFDPDDHEDLMARLGRIDTAPVQEFTGGHAETTEELEERAAAAVRAEQEGATAEPDTLKEVVLMLTTEERRAFATDAARVRQAWELESLSQTVLEVVLRAVAG